MRKEANYPDTFNADVQVNANEMAEAFQYLKSLPRNFDRPALESYIRGRENSIIDHEVAETFTDNFRNTTAPFYIPVSWSMTKAALVNLLGITEYTGHAAVNGIRFYAGLNGDNLLTLIAVSTTIGEGCSDDLTYEEQYPYYDYADPCPNSCSSRGNLKAQTALNTKVIITE